jgi:uncharacterized protein
MNIFEQSPGEHAFFMEGKVGLLETILTLPPSYSGDYLAILGHPHSLQGGTMHNKVVTILARVFKDLHIPSLRFNFRGVGQTPGIYDHGLGESEDMLVVAQQALIGLPRAHLCFAGFSFGSYVAYRAAAQCPHALLLTVAPPVHHYDYHEWKIDPSKWIVVQGEQDDVSPPDLVSEFAAQNNLSVLRFPEAGHFFHGQLIALKETLLETLPHYLK